MATQEDYERLRIDCGLRPDDTTTLPDPQAEDNFDRAALIYPDPLNPYGAQDAYTRVLTLEQLYARAVISTDYTANNSTEKASQLFDHYGKLLDLWRRKLTDASLGGASGGTAIFEVIGRSSTRPRYS
jgi:hypothetical protein